MPRLRPPDSQQVLKLGQEVFQGDFRSFRCQCFAEKPWGCFGLSVLEATEGDREGTRSTVVSKDTNGAVRGLK